MRSGDVRAMEDGWASRRMRDLNPVAFIGASGLGVLALAASRAAALGGTLRVASDRYQIRRLFRITGLHNYIPLSRTADEALAALPPAA